MTSLKTTLTLRTSTSSTPICWNNRFFLLIFIGILTHSEDHSWKAACCVQCVHLNCVSINAPSCKVKWRDTERRCGNPQGHVAGFLRGPVWSQRYVLSSVDPWRERGIFAKTAPTGGCGRSRNLCRRGPAWETLLTSCVSIRCSERFVSWIFCVFVACYVNKYTFVRV